MIEEFNEILELIKGYGGFMYGSGQLDINADHEKIIDRAARAKQIEDKIDAKLRRLFE